MKKLLLGAMLAAACITTDVDAAIFGKNKTTVAELKTSMGDNYENMLKTTSSNVTGLTKFFTSVNKKQEKDVKKLLNQAKTSTEKINTFIKSMKSGKKLATVDSNKSKAESAADDLSTCLGSLKNSHSAVWDEMKNAGLKSQLEGITMCLQALATKNSEPVKIEALKNKVANDTRVTNLLNKFKEICHNFFGTDIGAVNDKQVEVASKTSTTSESQQKSSASSSPAKKGNTIQKGKTIKKGSAV